MSDTHARSGESDTGIGTGTTARDPDAASPPVDTEQVLANRYGHRPRRDRIIAIVAASTIALTFVLWVLWAGIVGNTTFASRDLGYTVIDDRTVSVTFDITADPGTRVTCAIHAQNAKHGIVGWRIVELPPQERRMVQYTEVLRTTERPVNGLLYRCWLT